MATVPQQYDVAISFLHEDEPLAVQIHAKLSENFNVFVYPKKQEELAGTDGLESFRQVFHAESRMVVVLYRNRWGQTPWTRVEEAAIKERFLEQGWEWLLFVMLDEISAPPVWLPKSEIRLNYHEYGFEQLLGAIKVRAEKLGSIMRAETALTRATRLEKESEARAERDRLLSKQGMVAAGEEYRRLYEILDKTIEQLNEKLTALKIEAGSENHAYTLRTQHVSVNLYLYLTQPATQSRIVTQEWNGPLILPQHRSRLMFMPGDEPQRLAKHEWYFDYQGGYGWCWREHGQTTEFLTTAQLAEQIIKCLLDLHDRFEKGGIRRRGDRY